MGRIGAVAGFRSAAARSAYLAAYDTTLATTGVAFEHHAVTTTFGSTHVSVAGPPDGPAVVLLPAKNTSSTVWAPVLAALAATHRLHLVDAIADVGRSVASAPLRRRRDAVTWVGEVLDGLALGQPAIGGISNGAFQATLFATAHPERVRSLALVSPAGVFARMPLRWWLSLVPLVPSRSRARWGRFWATLVLDPSSPACAAFLEQAELGSEGMRTAWRDVFPGKVDDASLGRLTMPVLVVLADQDVIVPCAGAAARARATLPDGRVHVLSPCAHLATYDRPDALLELLPSVFG